ncbi:MAG: zinc ribbon domain-containing protein [Acutalibacteraceae bacterium]
MIIFGIGFTSYGVFGLISLLIQIIKVQRDSNLVLIEETAVKLFLTSFIALCIGVILLYFAIKKSKNKNSLEKLMNQEKNTIDQAQCRNCGLNLSDNARSCPRCGTIVERER